MLTRGMVLIALLCLVGCDPVAPLPVAPPAPVTATPDLADSAPLAEAMATAQQGLLGAERLGLREAIPALSAASQAADAALPTGARPADASVLTLIITSNIHGEREDCGCKVNPLGGLARQATLTLLAAHPADEIARKYWGDDLPEPTALLRADAGDLLFRSAASLEWSDDTKKQHMRAAKAVILALNVSPPDVVNVGELDLAMGWEGLRRLMVDAKFPFISANLRLPDGSAPLPASTVVKRAGKSVAFIGLLREQEFVPDYWKQRGVRIAPAVASYVAAAAALPADVDLVVLLSNQGLADTERLVVELRGAGARVDAALVSNTNALSPSIAWPAGVPMVEAMSQGKQLGRLDLWVPGAPAQVTYRNARQSPNEAIQDYGRKLGLYVETRDALRELERQRAVAQRDLPAGADALAADIRSAREAQINGLSATIETNARRMAIVADEVAVAAATLEQVWGAEAPEGATAWAEWRAVPVKLDIAQHPRTRKVLDDNKVEGL
jgi:2',3'-cyclic-nucleotide 2'-phosphodiesterase (5'-nucleotidase family)